MFKAAIFDLDGTLADTMGDLKISMNKMLRESGYPQRSEKELLERINYGAIEFVKRSLPEKVGDDEKRLTECFNLYNKAYDLHYLDTTKLYDGMINVLHTLKNAGIKLAVLSNKGDRHVKTIIDKLIPDGLFDIVLGHAQFPAKPNPESALHISQSFCVPPEEMVFVGDSDIDMRTAKNSNMTAVGVSWGYRPPEVLLENGADVVVSNMTKLAEFILNEDK